MAQEPPLSHLEPPGLQVHIFLHIGDVADFHRFQIDLKFDFVVQGHQRQHHFTQTASSRQQRLKQQVKTKFALHHSKNNRWLSTVAG